VSPEDVWIEGDVRTSPVTMLDALVEKELPRLHDKAPYDMATLWKVRDYRILVGLYYVVRLCEAMGIKTHLDPVLSFPLGPNAVSILEMSRAYSTLLEGKRYHDDHDASADDAIIIKSLVGPENEEVYNVAPAADQVLTRHTFTMINEILENVVLYGTGRKARNEITMRVDLGVGGKTMNIDIPSFGKTGTANEYSNSSYLGFIPGFADGKTELSLANGFVIGVYVGYDDNRPMKNDHLRIFGSSGALPIWIDVANAIVESDRYRQSIDPVDFAFLPRTTLTLAQPEGTITVPVDTGNGLALSLDQYFQTQQAMTTLYSFGRREGNLFRPERFFNPLKQEENSPEVRAVQEPRSEHKGDG